MKRWMIVGAAALGLCPLLAAHAQPQPQASTPDAASAAMGLKAIDTDGNGAISRAEASAALHQQFAHLDANHDGVISEDEFVTARLAQFDAADTDGNGELTRAELRQRFLALRKH
ncbi:EF-hand domain-containing protein [Solimonas marina]|uniref:EF-hand domain-containing protein n=1 Tax=Solimonas marina TaxID=2714601 RepID=A0A969WFZ7_9GAMM|nr:EF-hand domain-containing protein [Solimonas marina]NKF24601.1 hypothetical protein [Solimonas marina]